MSLAALPKRMRSVTHHLSTMNEEVLTYSSLEAGRELVRPAAVRVEEIILAALAAVEPLARSKRLAVDELCCNKSSRIEQFDLVNRDDIRVVKCGCSLCFCPQAAHQIFILNGGIRQKLEGNLAS